MPDLMNLAMEFARAFNKCVRSFRMYSPTHPQVLVDLKDAFSWLDKMTQLESPVALGTKENVLIVQGRPVREMTAILKAFTETLMARGLASFSVARGVQQAEFTALVDILVKKPEEVLKDGTLKPELLKPLHNIRINELRFVALEDGADENAVTALAAGGESQQDMLHLLSAFVNSDGGGNQGALSRQIAELVRSGAINDFVNMVDQIAAQLESSGVPAEERARKLSQLFKLLPMAEEVAKLRRVLVMQEDPPLLSEWTAALQQGGFEVTGVQSPPKAVEMLNNGTDWSGLIADSGFRGPEGVRFLDDVAKAGKRPVPVVLLSWDETIQKSAAAANYPNLRFLPMPIEPPALTDTVNEVALPPPVRRHSIIEIEADPVLKKELERAREIQSTLLPSELPEVPGFEIAVQYMPAQHVGGDYYDVIRLDGGRVGLIVADVSGKGISAAMIMVMARTVFHTVAQQHSSARAAVLAANDRITPDLPTGLFLTLLYAVFDPADATVTLVSCGHNPPFLWTQFQGMGLVQTVETGGAAMGLVRGPIFERALRESRVVLQPGEQLVFYTDGITEAMNESAEEFGEKKLIKALNRAGVYPAVRMAQGIVNAVLHHRGDAPASDDLTVMVLKRLDPSAGETE
ncbi:MAG: SpoIIE family protein phosphatase [Candidatus Brocadiae bacterium]|nr:SpoIIE family protein phosphatase [Candidatus Brocadiia bacterium]